MADFWIKANDTSPTICSTLTDMNGTAVDLAGATVTFVMRRIKPRTEVIYEEASVDQVGTGDDGSLGTVSYEWQPGDLDTPGGYYAEWQVDFNNGERETFPNDGHLKVAIVTDLGNGGS